MGADKLQTEFLQNIINNKKEVNIFLVSGIKLNGRIIDHDNTSILLNNKIEQLIFKNAISSIVSL